MRRHLQLPRLRAAGRVLAGGIELGGVAGRTVAALLGAVLPAEDPSMGTGTNAVVPAGGPSTGAGANAAIPTTRLAVAAAAALAATMRARAAGWVRARLDISPLVLTRSRSSSMSVIIPVECEERISRRPVVNRATH